MSESAPASNRSGIEEPESGMEGSNISVNTIGGSATVKETAANKTATGNKRKRGAGGAKDKGKNKAADKRLNLTVRYALHFWWTINNIPLELEGGGHA